MIPTQKELLQSYEELQFHPEKVNTNKFIQYTQYSRFDPRLAQIVVQFIQQYYQQFNPLEVWQLNNQMKYPQTLAALVDIVDIQNKNEKKKSLEWKMWKKCVQANISPAPFQSFYIALTSINPKRMLKQLEKNLKCFSRWGFYCDELPISEKNSKVTRTVMQKSQRLEILKKLLKEKKQITVNDYL